MTVLTVRKMGNSLGFTVPTDEAKRLGLHPGDKVDIKIEKVPDISSIFGIFKGSFGDVDEFMRKMKEEDMAAEARREAHLDEIFTRKAKRTDWRT